MSVRKVRMRMLYVLATVLLSSGLVFGQETRGTIRGRVTDPSDAVVAGVEIRATNVSMNITVSTKSNDAGNYEIPFLLPGMYRLTAGSAGFKTFTRDRIEIRIGERIPIEIRLEIGDAVERVTVTAETPLLESATASIGQVIDQRRLADLPIAHGNPFLLMALSSGAVYTMNPGLDRPFEPGHIVGYAMGGVKSLKSEITLDGSPNTMQSRSVGSMSAGYTPPADVVQEFKVQITAFDASVGHTQGGITSITLKSGGNTPHGTLYHSLLNPVLNANLFFANRAGQARGPFVYNRWGGMMTGPVRIPKVYNGKDRTFFTYGYEGIREGRAVGAAYGEGNLTVPTAREREGDFSALLAVGAQYQIYDPATRVAAPGGRYAIQPFPGNAIPSNRISPIAKNILNYWALPNVPGTADGTNNLIRVNDPQVTGFYNHIVRLDHNVSSNHRLFARVNMYNRLSSSGDWFRSPATGAYERWNPSGLAFDDVYHLNPTTFMNLRYSFYRLILLNYPKPETLGFDVASLGFPKNYVDTIPADVRRFPHITITNYTGSVNKWYDYGHLSHTLEGNITSLRGNHTLKMGMDARSFRGFYYLWKNTTTGGFEFGTTWTRGPFDNSPASPKGQGLASLLLGLPTGGRVDRYASFAQQATLWSFYFHDDWRATSRLTLNLGLRYELEGPLTERFDRSVRGYDFSTVSPLDAQVRANYTKAPISELPADRFRLVGGLTFAGVAGQPHTLWNRDKNNFMPRLGFAYTLNDKTVLRGGFGIYYAPLGTQRFDVNQTGFSQTTQLVPSLDNGLTFVATLANPFPNGIQQPRGAADGIMTYVGQSITFFDENPRAANQQRWQFGFQRELPQRVLLEMAYLGNHGNALQITRDFRPLPLQYLSRSPVRDDANINYLSAAVPNPFYALLPGTDLSGTTVSRNYLLSSGDYPHFTGLSSTNYDGYSWYHALQVRTERRFARGYTLNAAYTWSKFMEAISRLNGQFSPLQYVIADEDRPHRVVVSGIWELPFGRGKKLLGSAGAAVDKILGGWQLQGIYTGQGGPPLSFGNVLFLGNIHDITLPTSQRIPERWFNINAGFERSSAKQLSYNYRTFASRLNNVRGAGMNIWDLSAIKNTRAWERMTIQFRAEFLNAFNHPQFAVPNTSPTSTVFGQVTSQQGYSRRIQLGLKLTF